MIRRFVTMAEAVDVKAGIKHILERIEVASKSRPEQVKLCNLVFAFLINWLQSQFLFFSLRIRFN